MKDIKITEDQLDRVGQLSDKAENFLALFTPFMPDAMKLDAAKTGLQEIRDAARELYKELGGEAYG